MICYLYSQRVYSELPIYIVHVYSLLHFCDFIHDIHGVYPLVVAYRRVSINRLMHIGRCIHVNFRLVTASLQCKTSAL